MPPMAPNLDRSAILKEMGITLATYRTHAEAIRWKTGKSLASFASRLKDVRPTRS